MAVIELRGDRGVATRLQPLGIGVITAQDAAQAKERLAARQPVMTLIDTPAAGSSTPAAEIKALARRPEGARRRDPPGAAGDAQRRRRG